MTVASLQRTYDPRLTSFAAEVGETGPVSVAGGRTRWLLGGPLDDTARIVAAPSGIVEHQPAEMTVRVLAGTPVAELTAALAEAGQRCALPNRGGTVGGAVAVGQNHLGVLARGRVRSSVLAVTYVSAEGRLVTGGGATVKNVSGYDLPRLFTGSLGTLGALGEVVLRTNPIPATSSWFVVDGADAAGVADVWDRLYRPSTVLWNGQRVWVHLEGHADDVAAESRLLSESATVEEVDGPPMLPAERLSVPPLEIPRLVDDLQAVGDGSEVVAEYGVGVVHTTAEAGATVSTPDLDHVAAEVCARVKAAFDPSGRLNPGRAIFQEVEAPEWT
jgi:glycolate oxidase FAD binding subunit